LAAALVGCRSGGDVEALQRENFELSEQVLALQVQMDQCCRELRATHDLLAAKEHEAADSTRRKSTDDSSPSDAPRPPKIDLGTPGNGKKEPSPAPKFEPTPKSEPGKAGAGDGGPDASVGPNLGQMHNVSAHRSDQMLAAITLDQQFTTGLDADEARPGDEGLIVAIQPRIAAGDAVRVPGEVKIVAYDAHLLRQYALQPAKRQLAHVGTWLFTAADAATWFEEDQPRLRFELPWPPAGGPKGKDLHVVVQYKTADGRVLEAQSPVVVQLTGQRPKLAPAVAPVTAPTRNGAAGGVTSAVGPSREFSALKKPPEPVPPEVSRAPTTLPWRTEPPPTAPAEARPGTEVPSRQRPVWTPFR
jgi:hypothetical protein